MTTSINESKPSTGYSLLGEAYSGSLDVLIPFLTAGGPANYADEHGDTLLHAAAHGWQHQLVEILLICGADPNAQNQNGFTPLHSTIRSRDVPFESAFISEADPLVAQSKTFQTLLIRRADPTIKNIQGANPLHLAAWEGDLLAINLLARNPIIDDLTSNGATALALAFLNHHPACVKRLLQFGADPDFRLPSGLVLRDLINQSEVASVHQNAAAKTVPGTVVPL